MHNSTKYITSCYTRHKIQTPQYLTKDLSLLKSYKSELIMLFKNIIPIFLLENVFQTLHAPNTHLTELPLPFPSRRTHCIYAKTSEHRLMGWRQMGGFTTVTYGRMQSRGDWLRLKKDFLMCEQNLVVVTSIKNKKTFPCEHCIGGGYITPIAAGLVKKQNKSKLLHSTNS